MESGNDFHRNSSGGEYVSSQSGKANRFTGYHPDFRCFLCSRGINFEYYRPLVRKHARQVYIRKALSGNDAAEEQI